MGLHYETITAFATTPPATMRKTLTLPLSGAVFKRKPEPEPEPEPEITSPNTSLSNSSSESVEGSTRPYVLEGPLVRPGDTPGWANQPWHYFFRVGALQESGVSVYLLK